MHCPRRYTHFYCISPDAPTNPSLYWIGHYSDGRFDLANAKGPFRLDLGDILYAPNIFEDGNGRLLMWGWLQERRAVSGRQTVCCAGYWGAALRHRAQLLRPSCLCVIAHQAHTVDT
jgi:hypothetical protein